MPEDASGLLGDDAVVVDTEHLTQDRCGVRTVAERERRDGGPGTTQLDGSSRGTDLLARPRVDELEDHLPAEHLLVGEGVIEAVDQGSRDTCLLEAVEPLDRGRAEELLLELAPERISAPESHGTVGEPRNLKELVDVEHAAQRAPHRIGDRAHDGVAAIAGGEVSVGRDSIVHTSWGCGCTSLCRK